MSDDLDEPTGPAEVVDFNNPDAWGFCKYCAFQVATQLEPPHQVLIHERMAGGWTWSRCYGSLLEPTEQPDPEAWPITYTKVLQDALNENEANDDDEQDD
jgi:hypothetical protein